MEETETVLAQAKGEAGLRNGASISFGEGLVAFCREGGLGYGDRPQECQTDDENVESSAVTSGVILNFLSSDYAEKETISSNPRIGIDELSQ